MEKEIIKMLRKAVEVRLITIERRSKMKKIRSSLLDHLSRLSRIRKLIIMFLGRRTKGVVVVGLFRSKLSRHSYKSRRKLM